MTSEVVYLGGLRTEAKHLGSGDVINTDAPIDNNGKGEKFSPTDLVATALASCALTIMGIAAKTHNINIDGARAKVNKVMGTNPRRIVQIDVTFDFSNREYNEKQQQILIHAANTCPVYYSLHEDVVKNLAFIWS